MAELIGTKTRDRGNNIQATDHTTCKHYEVCKLICKFEDFVCYAVNCKPGFMTAIYECTKWSDVDSGEEGG